MPLILLMRAGSPDFDVALDGTLTSGVFRATALKVGAETFPLDSLLVVEEATWLELIGATGNYRFKIPAHSLGLELSATLAMSAGQTVFGKKFDLASGVSATITVRIPAENQRLAEPAIELGVCGRVELDTPGIFAAATVCYAIVLDELPMLFPMPMDKLPRWRVGLPSFGWRLPPLDFPWDYPTLPSLPTRWPAQSFDFPPLDGRISFKSIEVITTGNTELKLIVHNLVVEAKGQSIEADVTLVIKNGELSVADSSIRFIRPNLNLPSFPEWTYDDDCLIVHGTQNEINSLLSWLAPECDALRLSGNLPWTIRLLRGNEGLEELRIDIETGAQVVEFPGFNVDIAAGSVLHLVFRRPDGESQRFWLGLTTPAATAVKIRLPFSWGRADLNSRELLKSAGPAKELSLSGTVANRMTFVIAKFQDGRSPVFFRKTQVALDELDIQHPAETCAPTTDEDKALAASDFVLTAGVPLKLDGVDLSGFKFPFLQDELSDIKQFIEVSNFEIKAPQFANCSIEATTTIKVHIGDDALTIEGKFGLTYFWEKFAFEVNHDDGINLKLPSPVEKKELFGLKWTFVPAPSSDADFKLLTKGSNYQVKQAPGSRFLIDFDRATDPDKPIRFEASNFSLSPKGVSLDAAITDSPAKLAALDTDFRFTEGAIQIRDNSIAGFTIGGSGPLPPALVGPAIASIRMQFEQSREDHSIHLICADARLQGESLLKCESTRFQFAVTALGLKFVEDSGRYHLYFTLSGTARFVLGDGDNPQGPLGWLPAIEMQMIECPLTTDVSVLAQHIEFLIVLPKPVTFAFLGCFAFELRAIGFAPSDPVFREPKPAMLLSGQIKFSVDSDAVDARIDFHKLHIGLPAAGKVFPQLYLKGLGVKLAVGSAFELAGYVQFIDEGDDLGGGVRGEGFYGRGDMQIQGLPRISAGFAFLRVRRDPSVPYVRAWFLYLEANRFSLQFPVIRMFLREVGIGFGYRFTLAMIKSVDEVDDPRELLKVLKEQAKRQGELSRFEAWRVDLEEPGEDPRWTIALRAMIAQNSAGTGFTDWSPKKEENLPNLFLLDVVAALRSDLTFLMVARAWFLTNYYDFTMELPSTLRTEPLLTGFVLLSPRKKRLLANLSSNPNAVFGEHSPMPEIVKSAVKSTQFSATLLVEPGLAHYELGWPNQLRWEADMDALKLQFCGGMIYRVSKTEFVTGQSFLARGTLRFDAGVDFGFVGARLSATAEVAYGARYIGVLAFDDPKHNSAFYGGAGIEINVAVSVDFWIEIDLLFGSITLHWGFSFAVNFTASVEVGILLDRLPGVRGHATLGIAIMGHDLHFGIRVAINEDAVQTAFNRTEKFLHVGLEAGDVEAIPGTGSATSKARAIAGQHAGVLGNGASHGVAHAHLTNGNGATVSASHAMAPAAAEAAGTGAVAAGDSLLASGHDLGPLFDTPSYRVLIAPVGRYAYFLLVPGAEILDGTRASQRRTRRERGFLPVPPNATTTTTEDFKLVWTLPPQVEVKQADPTGAAGAFSQPVTANHSWTVKDWKSPIKDEFAPSPEPKNGQPSGEKAGPVRVADWLGLAFQFQKAGNPNGTISKWDEIEPIGDPALLFLDAAPVVDERVRDPTDDAFEAAVRGATEQFTAAPYFKRSANEYDVSLRNAFDTKTTLYAPGGNVPPTTAHAVAEVSAGGLIATIEVQSGGEFYHPTADLPSVTIDPPKDSGTQATAHVDGNKIDLATGTLSRDAIVIDTPGSKYDPNKPPAVHITPPKEKDKTPSTSKSQQIHQTRSVILRSLITDFQAHINELRKTDEATHPGNPFDKDSLACRMGLVFRGDLGANESQRRDRFNELTAKLNTASISQRTAPDAPDIGTTPVVQKIKVFNPPRLSFAETAPRFERRVSYAHEGTVALDWELKWPNSQVRASAALSAALGTGSNADKVHAIRVDLPGSGYDPLLPPEVSINPPAAGTQAKAHIDPARIDEKTGKLQDLAVVIDDPGSGYTEAPSVSISAPPHQRNSEDDPEHHLDHYIVRRRWLDGNVAEREFRIKPADILHRVEGTQVKRLRPRFKFVDHFEDEPADTLTSLPPEGRRYAYSITPVDLTGIPSSRPLTVVVRRQPATPPAVVTDGEWIVDYVVKSDSIIQAADGLPRQWPVQRMMFAWTPPVDPEIGPRVPIEGIRLVFRRDEILPLGQYAQDSDVGGPRSQGLPTSNARPLRTDRTFEFKLSDHNDIQETIHPDSNLRRFYIDITHDPRMPDLGAFFGNLSAAPDWQPTAWRAFVQTRSAGGVYSALVPLTLRLRVLQDEEPLAPFETAPEERRPPTIEWLSVPVALAMLPPRDMSGRSGFAMVPTPQIGPLEQNQTLPSGEFRLHPARRRALEFIWNQVGTPNAPVAPKPMEYPREFHSGYELHEFDVDANLAEKINELSAPEQPFDSWARDARMRMLQRFEMLPQDLLLVTPPDTGDPQKWEAWYPSMMARIQNAGNTRPHVKGSEATVSPWYSWRDSLLVWPGLSHLDEEVFTEPTSRPKRWFQTLRLHKILQKLIDDVIDDFESDGSGDIIADLAPAPPVPATLASLMAATDPLIDPYGWGLLQRLGLSASFVLRNNRGDLVKPELLWPKLLKHALKTEEVAADDEEKKQHLHLELLYQPAKSTRLARDESQPAGGALSLPDALAVVQISMRPVVKDIQRYRRFTADWPADGKSARLTVNESSGKRLSFVIKGGSPEKMQVVDAAQSVTTDVQPPIGPQLEVLVRYLENAPGAGVPVITLTIDGITQAIPSALFDATDNDTRYFTYDAKEVATDIADLTTADPKAGLPCWMHLKYLIEAQNPRELPEPEFTLRFPDSPRKEDCEDKGFPVSGIEVLAWLQRFFDHGPGQVPGNATGPWFATAYPRSLPIMAIAPNPESGVLEYCRPVEDLYAHAWRYYLRPVGRYDAFWSSIAQSHKVFRKEPAGDDDQILRNLDRLRLFTPPPPGGLDLIMPRIRPIKAPMILFSGRLDGPPPATIEAVKPKPPGKTWQVVLSKHAEQTLSESNRTLARRLEYRQQSVALLRRFQFDREAASATYLASITLPATGTVIQGSQTLTLIVGQSATTLTPATNDVAGIIAALQAQMSGEEIVRWDRPSANPVVTNIVIPAPSKEIRLTLTPPAPNMPADLFLKPRPAFFDYLTTIALPPTGAVIQNAQTLTLVIDGIATPLTPASNNVAGILATIEALLPGEQVARFDRLDGGHNPVASHIVIRAPLRTIQLTLTPPEASKPADLLMSVPVVSRHTTQPLALPGPYPPIPRHDPLLPLKPTTIDDLRQLDLPSRLGRFGEGAVVYQWQAIPYFYEHLLLAVAQTTNVCSEISTFLQRDFEYQSPEPRALMDAEQGSNGNRYRRIRIRLENFWNCLPPEAQQQWPTERPETSAPDEPRPYAAISDPAVVYQFILKRAGDVMQVLSQVFFSSANLDRYDVRNFPATISGESYKTEIVKRLPWGTDSQHPYHEYLETRLTPSKTLTNLRAITSRHSIDAVELPPSTSGWPAPSTPADFAHFPRAASLALVRRLTTTEITDLAQVLTGSPRDIAFRVQADRFMDRVRQFHASTTPGDPDIHEELGVGIDQLQELADDPKLAVIDPRLKQVSWAFTDWLNPLTTEQRKILEGDTAQPQLPGWITISPAGATLKVLNDALQSTRTFEFTATDVHPADPTSGAPLFGRVSIVVGSTGQLVWSQGPTTAAQIAALQAWTAPSTGFGSTFISAVTDLLAMLDRLEQVQFGYDPADTVPTIVFGHPLFGRLILDSTFGKATWKLGPISAAEKTSLGDLADVGSGNGPSFRVAMQILLPLADKFVVQVPIQETDFAPRPQLADFAAAGLASKVGFLRSVMRMDGLMLRREEESLERACQADVDRASMRLLYNDSLRNGFDNAELKIMAYRGSADARSQPIEPFL